MHGLQLAYLPFKKTQVQDYMYYFGKKIEPKQQKCFLCLIEAQIPSAYAEESSAKEIVVLVLSTRTVCKEELPVKLMQSQHDPSSERQPS